MAKATLISRIKSNASGRAKSSVSTLALVLEAIDHQRALGDWTPLAWLVGLSEGADIGRIRAIVKAACGITFVQDEKQPSGWKAKMPKLDEAAPDNGEALATLAAFVAYGVGFRSKMLEDGVTNAHVVIPALLPKKEKADYDIATLGRAVLHAKAEGHDEADILAYVKRVLVDDAKANAAAA